MTGYYVSPFGSDNNTGLSQTVPKKTVTTVIAGMSASDVLYIDRRSLIRSLITLTLSGAKINTFGPGSFPIITGCELFSGSATQPDSVGLPNVWLMTGTHAEVAKLDWSGVYATTGRYHPSELQKKVGVTGVVSSEDNAYTVADETAALAYVNANAGWFYYVYSGGSHKYYVYSLSNPLTQTSVRWEYKTTDRCLVSPSDGEIRNLHMVGTADRSGVVGDNTVATVRTWRNCIVQDGGLHTWLPGSGAIWEECVSIANPVAASCFHLNSPSNSSVGALYRRCMAIGPYAAGASRVTGANGRVWGSDCKAFYNHTSAVPWVGVVDCESQGADVFCNFGSATSEAAIVYVIGCRMNDRTGANDVWPKLSDVPNTSPKGWVFTSMVQGYFEDCLFYCGGGQAFKITSANSVVVFRNCRFVVRTGAHIFRMQGATNVSVQFRNCTFIVDDYDGAGVVTNSTDRLFENQSSSTGTVTATDCVFIFEKSATGTGKPIVYKATTDTLITYTQTNCVFSSNISNVPSGGVVWDDTFTTPKSWRTNDWTYNPAGHAISLGAGWRDAAATYYRPIVEALATTLEDASAYTSVPDTSNVLDGIDRGDGTLGTYVTTSINDVQSGVTFGPSSSLTGVFVAPSSAQVLDGIGYGANSSEFTGTVVLPADGDVQDGVTFGPSSGLTGTFVVPPQNQVLNGIQYGTGGTEFTGTMEADDWADVEKEQIRYALGLDGAKSAPVFSEPMAPPALSAGMNDKLTWMFMWLRNKSTESPTQRKLYADDGVTVVSTEELSDAASIFTKGEQS